MIYSPPANQSNVLQILNLVSHSVTQTTATSNRFLPQCNRLFEKFNSAIYLIFS